MAVEVPRRVGAVTTKSWRWEVVGCDADTEANSTGSNGPAIEGVTAGAYGS
jgi:hypothetical protein